MSSKAVKLGPTENQVLKGYRDAGFREFKFL